MEAEREASPEQEATWWFEDLFNGVPLDDDVREQIRAVIARTVARQRAIRPPGPGVWDYWDEAVRLYAERDATLASLLATPAQQAAFAANAAEMRQRLAELRAQAR